MKKHLKTSLGLLIISLFIGTPILTMAQSDQAFIDEYLTKISGKSTDSSIQSYRMTAIYTNRDLYGEFIDKTNITGDYTRGLAGGNVKWNDAYVSVSKDFNEPFKSKVKLEYIEDFTYKPSPNMLDAVHYKNFPPTPEAVFARNLIWDMMAFEGFAWDHLDSLKLNEVYRISDIGSGEFDMADIGTYSHEEVKLCWTGVTTFDNDMYAVLEFEALDNIVALSMDAIKTKGTEQYWGTILVSLQTKEIGQAVMYSGSIQEIEITGMETKFIIKTIRELWLDKIN